jgi:hypothetical protein
MDDELVDAAQAAAMLQTSVSRVHQLTKSGVLRPKTKTRLLKDRRFRVTDIASFIEIRRKGSNPEAAFVEARQAAMEARSLRREVERIRFVIGLDMIPLGIDRDTVVSLLLKTEDTLRGPPVRDPEELLTWARTLHSLTETHFEAITFHTDQKEPWRAFLALGRKICAGENVLNTRDDPELYSLYRLMNMALRRVRQTAYFHIRDQHGEGRATRMLPEVKGCPHEDVIALSFNNMLWEAPPVPPSPGRLSLTTEKSGSLARSRGSGG